MYPVEYEVTIWNDIEDKMETVHGITFGETFTEAVQNIEDYYGDEMDSVKMNMLEESNIYEFEMTQKDFMHGAFKCTIEKW